MNWQHFLDEFLTVLEQNSLEMNHQPARWQAGENELLLGLGNGLDNLQAGISLNQKGTPHKSVAEFAACADSQLSSIWQQKLAGKDIADLVYVIEDFSPDTCLGLILFWARVKAIGELPREWIDYSNRWESGDVKTTGKFEQSWGVLHSALAHYHLQPGNKREGFKDCLSLVLCALQQAADPAHLPELPSAAYQKALFQLRYEHQEYEKALQHGLSIQLAVPMAGSPQRQLLVDAFINQEEIALGCAKYFLRNDSENTWRRQGFSLMALYPPRHWIPASLPE